MPNNRDMKRQQIRAHCDFYEAGVEARRLGRFADSLALLDGALGMANLIEQDTTDKVLVELVEASIRRTRREYAEQRLKGG